MCELTHEAGDFWRDVFSRHAALVKFDGFVFYRTREEQAKVDAEAKKVADLSVREYRARRASDKALLEAFEHVAYSIERLRPHLRAQLADAYRAGDHAELGRIVAAEMELRLREKAEDAAEEECAE